MPKAYVKELAELVGLSPRRIYQINEELSDDEKLIVRDSENEKKADMALFVQRWVSYREKLVRGAGEMTLDQAKTMHEQIKMKKTEYEVKRLTGEYVSRTDFVLMAQEIVTGVKNSLLHLPETLAPTLAQTDDPEIVEDILTTAIRERLEDLARMKDFHPDERDPFAEDDEEAEEDRKWENE